ncbi:MAG: YfhO family protein, partial [Muribaculaceae bacterium]|nr:YfhO family protein [Muribaculaceae bacterium]
LKVATHAVADKKFRDVLGTGAVKTPGDTIYETSYAPDKLEYAANSAKGGVAVFSEIYFPWGWEATIDGQPAEIGRVNYVLRGLRVPAGKHNITFVFNPKSLKVANTVGIVSAVLIYLLCGGAIAVLIIKVRKQRKV